MRAFGRIQDISGSTTTPELWNGETGWPTDGGTNYNAATAGTKNAVTYWKSGVCGMLNGVSTSSTLKPLTNPTNQTASAWTVRPPTRSTGALSRPT